MKRANFRYLTVGRPAAERRPEAAIPRRRKAADARSVTKDLAEALWLRSVGTLFPARWGNASALLRHGSLQKIPTILMNCENQFCKV
jgi:hypothetical protein